MKYTVEHRQQTYERQCAGLVKNLTREPIRSLTTRVNSGLTESLIASRCLSILYAVHGGAGRLILHILKGRMQHYYYGTKGAIWRFWQKKIKGKTDDEILDLIFGPDDGEVL